MKYVSLFFFLLAAVNIIGLQLAVFGLWTDASPLGLSAMAIFCLLLATFIADTHRP